MLAVLRAQVQSLVGELSLPQTAPAFPPPKKRRPEPSLSLLQKYSERCLFAIQGGSYHQTLTVRTVALILDFQSPEW